jgi:hypothetical protein
MSLEEFGDISASHLSGKRKKWTTDHHDKNGVFPACCQKSSLHLAHTQWPAISLPVIQIGHWVATPKPETFAVQFVDERRGMKKQQYYSPSEYKAIANRNMEDKQVIFTDLVPGSTERMVEMVKYEKKQLEWRNLTGDIALLKILDHSLAWQPAKPNTWYSVDYVFRMKASNVAGAVVIHKTLPSVPEYAVESFRAGNSGYWNLDQWDHFLPKCAGEESRTPVDLSPCCASVLLGLPEPMVSPDFLDGEAEGADDAESVDSDATDIVDLSFQPFSMEELEADTTFQIPKKANEFEDKWKSLLEAAERYGKIESWGSAAFIPIREWTVQALEPHPHAISFYEEGVRNHFLKQKNESNTG